MKSIKVPKIQFANAQEKSLLKYSIIQFMSVKPQDISCDYGLIRPVQQVLQILFAYQSFQRASTMYFRYERVDWCCEVIGFWCKPMISLSFLKHFFKLNDVVAVILWNMCIIMFKGSSQAWGKGVRIRCRVIERGIRRSTGAIE